MEHPNPAIQEEIERERDEWLVANGYQVDLAELIKAENGVSYFEETPVRYTLFEPRPKRHKYWLMWAGFAFRFLFLAETVVLLTLLFFFLINGGIRL